MRKGSQKLGLVWEAARAEAAARNERRYVSQRPCRHHGEKPTRYTQSSQCVACISGRNKKIEEGYRVGREEVRKKNGPDTKLTPEVSEKICRLVAAGNFFEVACASSGVSHHTACKWLLSGARDHKEGNIGTIYALFWLNFTKAEADAEIGAVIRIRKAGAEDYRAMQWWLEKSRKTRWGNNISIDLKSLSDESLIGLIARLSCGGSPSEGVDTPTAD